MADTQPNTQMKKFYRLEDSEKCGIYLSGSSASVACCKFSQKHKSKHPGPERDSKLVEECEGTGIFGESYACDDKWFQGRDYVFGFSSPDQFRAWFFNDKFLKFAEKKGIKLNLYETDDSFCGNTQMIARKETLIFVGECDILTGKRVETLLDTPDSLRI